ncbi:MAG TPA: hypothetical protein VGO57_03950 [Verrucomicrobiae bacterium]|jgi:hypothetical protein
MRSESLNSSWLDIAPLLRGEVDLVARWSAGWDRRWLLFQIVIIIVGAGSYGAAMGWWRDPQQAFYVAIKFPLIILLTTFGNALLNAMLAPLLGLNSPFRQSFSAIVMSNTVTAVILGAFSPLIFFLAWNAPAMSASAVSGTAYNFILLTHVAVIALAGTAGNLRLLQLLTRLAPGPMIARRVLCAWLAGNFLLGSQLSWILRPFIGSPSLPVQFIRPDSLRGNFYETVFNTLRHLF